ncbi:glycoside hydrolase family 3 C-terminal domain-containing protein [Leuconostoc mesenteroides]|uniref:glycoside hydrolase family 3 C-terminal domain-containing protein n=1 Tax=Leuconostoc mesenteroides TaxID=1245 RepID=UPI0021DADF3B|nr:glycoside hydrolase family 3 C-terminal domain-containing protein [Leuconostoc mesenteroides]MBZ1525956.1 glycoside hydrolase family 3 C-terminal domain-containing protein [Leuconostoc mesenteroides]
MTNPTLPDGQIAYLRALQALGKPIVTIVVTGRPLVLTTVDELSDAVLISFFPGTMGAEALSSILVGATEPTGRLPMTFSENAGQIPIYYNAYNTGRPVEVGMDCS